MSNNIPPTKRLILILGGARSGKSAYAEQLAAQLAADLPIVYLATATAGDDEMRARIAHHRATRPAHWATIEAPLDPATALQAHGAFTHPSVILLDCLTLLIANILLADAPQPGHSDPLALLTEDNPHPITPAPDAPAPDAEARSMSAIHALLTAYHAGPSTLLLVSNEVGMGLVPTYPLGRLYRDVLGRVNAHIAHQADHTLLLLAGLPIELKTLAQAWREQASHLQPNTPSG